jgi:hypothetical protein
MAKEESGLTRTEKEHVCDRYFVEMFRKHGTDPMNFLKRLHKFSN